MQGSLRKKSTLLKVAALILFTVAAIYLVRFSPVKHYFTVQYIEQLIEAAGPWAPIAFVFIYAGGVCIFIPGTFLTALGATLFGAYWGFLYVWFGAMLGACMAFYIGRYLGRDFATSLIGKKLQHYDDAVERNGFATVLYLRLIYCPFAPMNFGMGLTKVCFRDYFLGTAFGITIGTFIFTFFIGTIKDVWASGRWEELLHWQVFLAIALFTSSLFIPKVLKKYKAETEQGGEDKLL